MKHMREKVCDVCGAKFMGGPCASICPDCRPLYTRRYLTLYKRRHMAGAVSDASIRAEAIAWVRAQGETKPAPAPPSPPRHTHCGYCGRELGPRDARRGYCQRCVARGYHWLHEVTGRTREGAGDELP